MRRAHGSQQGLGAYSHTSAVSAEIDDGTLPVKRFSARNLRPNEPSALPPHWPRQESSSSRSKEWAESARFRPSAGDVQERDCGQRGDRRRKSADKAGVPTEDPATGTGAIVAITVCRKYETKDGRI
jgi:hypothetical protein